MNTDYKELVENFFKENYIPYTQRIEVSYGGSGINVKIITYHLEIDLMSYPFGFYAEKFRISRNREFQLWEEAWKFIERNTNEK